MDFQGILHTDSFNIVCLIEGSQDKNSTNKHIIDRVIINDIKYILRF